MSDPVNHPVHYTSHPSGVECITVTEHYNFCIGNAIKYLWRAGIKEGSNDIQDLEKACWYVRREIERRKREHAKTDTYAGPAGVREDHMGTRLDDVSLKLPHNPD